MANRVFSAGIKRITFIFGARRHWSSVASISEESFPHRHTLKNRILGLKSPTKSAIPALQNWVDQGNKLSHFELSRISRTLLKSKRHHRAFEVNDDCTFNFTMERGGCPNYKTWKILIEGFVKNQRMDKAIIAMKRALALLKDCDWRPPQGLVLTIAEYLEKQGNFDYANEFVTEVYNFGLANLPLYNILLRMHLSSNKPPFHILKMMDKDKVEMDNETLSILKAFTG